VLRWCPAACGAATGLLLRVRVVQPAVREEKHPPFAGRSFLFRTARTPTLFGVRRLLVSAAALLLGASIASADIPLGAVAPDFTKSKLGGGTLSLSEYCPGHVVVLFLLGYQ